MNLREWALPVYTVLIQLVTGMFLFLWVMRTYLHTKDNEKDLDELAKIPVVIFLFTIVIANFGAHFHLSHPLKSFLAISNIRTSWLSREVAFTMLMTLFTAALLVRLWFTNGTFRQNTLLGWGAVLCGIATVWCMAFIYLLPTQEAWNTSATVFSYYGTMLLLGGISLFVILLMDIGFTATHNEEGAAMKVAFLKKTLWGFVIAAVLAAIWVVMANTYQISTLVKSPLESAQTSFMLLNQLYRPLVILRLVLLALGLGCFIICSIRTLSKRQDLNAMIGPIYLACLCVMVGEILERFLFYAIHVRVGL